MGSDDGIAGAERGSAEGAASAASVPTVSAAPVPAEPAPAAFRLRNVGRQFKSGGGIEIDALDIPRGGVVAVMGLSGSGKSTLLSLLGGLAPPAPLGDSAGAPSKLDLGLDRDGVYGVHDLLALRGRQRFDELGFVFQDAHLLRNATALSNVAVALAASRRTLSVERLFALSDDVNLKIAKLSSRARQLSGGEKQRAAVGRGIARAPQILLADEPTANLDPENGVRIMGAICHWQREDRARRTVVWVTHNVIEASLFADTIVMLAPPPRDPANDRQPPGKLMPGYTWPMANPHDSVLLRAMLTQAPALPAASADRRGQTLAERDGAIALAGARRDAAQPGDTETAPKAVEPFGPTAIRRIAWAELFGSAWADTLPPPPAVSRLVGRADAFVATPVTPRPLWRRLAPPLALLAATVLAWLAVYRPGVVESVLGFEPTAMPGQLPLASVLLWVAGGLCLAAVLPTLLAFTKALGWMLLAFDRWFQLVMFLTMAIFVYALVLSRDALEAKFVADLKSLDLGHIVVAKTKRRGSERLDQTAVMGHDEELKRYLADAARPRSPWEQTMAMLGRGLASGLTETLLAAETAARMLLPVSIAEQTAEAIAARRMASMVMPPPSVFGRWIRYDTQAIRRSGTTQDPARDCDLSVRATRADVLAASVEPAGEPALKVMRYLTPGGRPLGVGPIPTGENGRAAALSQLALGPPPRRMDLGPDADNVPGVIVSESFLRHRLKYADNEPIDPVFCLFGNRYRLVRIEHIVRELPKEQLVPEFHVLVSHDLYLDVYRDQIGDGARTPEFETEAIYIADPRRIQTYIAYFRQLTTAGETELPDAFRQISKSLETMKTLSDMATAIIYGVVGICLVIVTFMTFGFIQQNEKSLCVMRAFGVGPGQIAWLVLLQTVVVWLAAAAVAWGIVLVSRGLVITQVLAPLQVGAEAAAAAEMAWAGYILGLTILIVVMSWATVLYWWWTTASVGDRLKQLD